MLHDLLVSMVRHGADRNEVSVPMSARQGGPAIEGVSARLSIGKLMKINFASVHHNGERMRGSLGGKR